jgi:hypothetical protein
MTILKSIKSILKNKKAEESATFSLIPFIKIAILIGLTVILIWGVYSLLKWMNS